MTAVACGTVESSCVCVLPKDHDDMHECADFCGGRWTYEDGELVVDKWPGGGLPTMAALMMLGSGLGYGWGDDDDD